MIVYSNKIIQFVSEIKRAVKDILSTEVRLKVARDRFYDRKERNSYPIKIVVYNTKAMLGYFDPDFYELGFHECLMHASKEQLLSVIRHEIAHYLTFMNHGGAIQPHGPEFRDTCSLFGWGEDVYRATLCLEGGQDASLSQESSIFRKVQKLLALSASSNPHEAEVAMIKSQQLLLKHNIDSKYIDADDEEKMCLKRIFKQKKQNAKMNAIARILETFFVNTVYCRGGDFIYLEILGTAVNVEIAEYVAGVLDGEFDNLWNIAKQTAHLKGTIAKNSFFTGLARGYCTKIQALKREYPSEVTTALIVIEKKLSDALKIAYPHLRRGTSSASHCRKSSALGEKMGRQLNINPAVKSSSNPFKALLPFFKK